MKSQVQTSVTLALGVSRDRHKLTKSKSIPIMMLVVYTTCQSCGLAADKYPY